MTGDDSKWLRNVPSEDPQGIRVKRRGNPTGGLSEDSYSVKTAAR